MTHRCTVHKMSHPSLPDNSFVFWSVTPPRLWTTASFCFKSLRGGRTLCFSTPPLFLHLFLLLRHQCLRLLLFPVLQLPLHKGVKEAGPGLVLTVVGQVRPYSLGEVEEHVPRVPWDAPDTWGVLRQEVQPVLQDGGRVLGENQAPQGDGDVALQRALALLGVQAKLEGEAVQVLEVLLAPSVQQHAGEASADALQAVRPDGLAAFDKLLPGDTKQTRRGILTATGLVLLT